MLPSERNARRRLNAILRDEEYGPKLARLRGMSERRVLDLISENRGREARKAILEEDEKRRERNRISRTVKRKFTLIDQAVNHFLSEVEWANPKTVRKNVSSKMTDGQRRMTLKMSQELLREAAKIKGSPWNYH